MLVAVDDFDAFRTSEFQTALIVGVCALSLTALGLTRRSRSGRVLGVVLPGAWLVALFVATDVPVQLVLGLVCMLASGVLHDAGIVALSAAVALGSVGAWIVSTAVDGPDISGPTVFVLIAAVGVPIVAFAVCEHSARVILPVVALTLAGFYATLPDTEWIVVGLGAVAPLLLLSQPNVPLRLGAAGAFTLSGLMAATIADSWGGRETAIVGAYGSLGLVIVVPLAVLTDTAARTFWIERPRVGRFPWLLVILVTHGVLVLVCSRGAGLRSSVAAALGITLVALAAAEIGILTIARRNATTIEPT